VPSIGALAGSRRRDPVWPLIAVLAILLGALGGVPAHGASLHEQIDRVIASKAGGPLAGRCDDAEFLRRVSLDLAGVIPTAEQARSFLANTDPQKREKLIDSLLASPEYARRMSQAMTVMLLERREGKSVSDQAWRDFLQASFAANKPWDQMVREIVGADGRDPATRASVKFFVDGGRADHHVMTQDVARLFLGMNIQCAQCHDHPTVTDYKQADYFGLYAFLHKSKVANDPKTKLPLIAEDPTTEKVSFTSVFVPDEKGLTGPRVPGGSEVAIPEGAAASEVAQPAADGLPAVLKFRPRVLLSEELPRSTNAHFVRNSVNRFWFLMMGRGLVHPLDLHHSDNPPSHPELLQILADDFVAKKFDVRALLREIALSESYQRSSVLPDGVASKDVAPESYRVAVSKPLSSEQMAFSLMQATGHLPQVLAAPLPENSKFTVNDYVNGRIKDPPANLPETLVLFGAVFGNPPGEAEEDFAPSMASSLFLMNERLVLKWLAPQPGNLVERAAKMGDSEAVAELWLSTLSRLPGADDQADAVAYLAANGARRPEAIGELAWALLASAEFRLNH
jgi:hypothetical protein